MSVSFDTAFTRLVGIDLPIVQAPIGGMARPALAGAVSEAGALGMLSLTWSDPDEIKSVVRDMQARTSRPFGVNLILDWPQEDRVRQLLDLGVRIFSFFWGDPAAHLAAVHAAGGLVMNTVGDAAEARQVVDSGVDIVVAQGWEAGGHVRGQVATLPLIPAVLDAVGDVPVVAAGGIGDGRGLAAVLAAGAAGGWLGTRFVMATETRAHDVYRQALRAATETSTVYSSLFDIGWQNAPHRTLRNSTVEAWESAGRPGDDRPGEGDIVGTLDGEPVHRYESTSPHDAMDGPIEPLPLWAGQSVGVIRDVLPAGEIVRQIAADAAAALTRATDAVREPAGG